MNTTISVSPEIIQHLDSIASWETTDINDTLRSLIVFEYQRRLARYRLTDRQMTQKYKMSFEIFEVQKMTQQHGYSWEVESNAMAWETAIDGIHTMEAQLAKLAGKEKNGDNLHPFGQPHLHEPTPEGMSPQPIHQFLTEVETILLENDLI